MSELQRKIYDYFQRNKELKVLFVFDNSLMHDYQMELDPLEWEPGFQYVVFGGDWFTTKYKIMHEWQDMKTVLLFLNVPEPISQEAMANFPLLGALKANMAYKELEYDAFIQQYHIPMPMAMFVQRHIQDLQRNTFLRWAKPYMSPSLDMNTAMCLLLSFYLEQERCLQLDQILIRIMLLGGTTSPKRDTFFRKLYAPANQDVLKFVNDQFLALTGQELNANSHQHVEKIIESLKYNVITQQLTVHPSDPYKAYKIVNSLQLQRINQVIDTALKNDLFLTLIKEVGCNVHESKLIELYGADAPFYYISADLCLPIMATMADEVKQHPDNVLQRLSSILNQFSEHREIAGIGNFIREVAIYYQQSNAYRAISVRTPDTYVDSYINNVSSMDMAYRHAIGYYYTAKQNIEPPEYAERLKKQLDFDYAEFANDLNLDWMNCIRETPAGFGAISMIGRQADFYKKMVQNCETKQVVIVSDALRYELAEELFQGLLTKKHIVSLEAMLASIPTETKYTKLTLFPHNELTFSERDCDMLVDGALRPTVETRTELLQRYIPNAICVDYKTVASQDAKENRELFKHPLVYIMHNSVDDAGHADSPIQFTQGCAKALEELHALILKLHDSYNVVNILVTADHGFLFQDLPIKDYTKHQISDDAIERKSRYYLTESKENIPTMAKFPLKAISPMQSEKEFFVGVPCGTNRFATQGGGYQFAHGGAALQEVIVPIVISRYQRTNDAKSKVGVALVSNNLSVVSSSLKVSLVQSDAVDTLHQERTVLCALYNGSIPVTPVIELLLNSTDADITTSRMFNITLTLNTVVQSSNLELRVYDKDDRLNPLIQRTVINQTLIERDEF